MDVTFAFSPLKIQKYLNIIHSVFARILIGIQAPACPESVDNSYFNTIHVHTGRASEVNMMHHEALCSCLSG